MLGQVKCFGHATSFGIVLFFRQESEIKLSLIEKQMLLSESLYAIVFSLIGITFIIYIYKIFHERRELNLRKKGVYTQLKNVLRR